MKISELGKPPKPERPQPKVEFVGTNETRGGNAGRGSGASFLARFVIRTGLAKTPARAQAVLGVVAVLALILSVVILRGSQEEPAPSSDGEVIDL